MSYGNVLGAFYWKLPTGRNDTVFVQVLLETTLGRRNVKYTEMFMGRQIIQVKLLYLSFLLQLTLPLNYIILHYFINLLDVILSN